MSKIGFLIKYGNDGQHYHFDNMVDSLIEQPKMALVDAQAIGRSDKLKPEHVDKIISSRPGLYRSVAGEDFIYEMHTRRMLKGHHIETMHKHAIETRNSLDDWMPIYHSDAVSDEYLKSGIPMRIRMAARNNNAARKILDAAKENPARNPYGHDGHVAALRNLNVVKLSDLPIARQSEFPQVKTEVEETALKMRLSAKRNRDPL